MRQWRRRQKNDFDFLRDSGTSPSDYDLILTGDLGFTGSKLLYELFEKEHGIDLRPFHNDCGLMIYDLKGQDVNSGGSGCGCSASVLCSHVMKEMRRGALKGYFLLPRVRLCLPPQASRVCLFPRLRTPWFWRCDLWI